MARIRTIKPEFFRHEELFEAERKAGLPLRLAFAGLWTAADREGRFKWQPRALKLDCLPYDDVDFGAVLDALLEARFIVKYQGDDGSDQYGYIPGWNKHQHINQREAKSTLPDPAGARTCVHVTARGEGKGREGKEKDAAIAAPVPNSEETELYRRGKQILGSNAGGLIKNLIKAKQGSFALARAAIETASTKQDAREYIGGVINGGTGPPSDARERGDAW